METMLLVVKELLPMILAAAVAASISYHKGFGDGFQQSAEACKDILDKQLELIFGELQKDIEEIKGEGHEEDNV